jgi:hypothetical protein
MIRAAKPPANGRKAALISGVLCPELSAQDNKAAARGRCRRSELLRHARLRRLTASNRSWQRIAAPNPLPPLAIDVPAGVVAGEAGHQSSRNTPLPQITWRRNVARQSPEDKAGSRMAAEPLRELSLRLQGGPLGRSRRRRGGHAAAPAGAPAAADQTAGRLGRNPTSFRAPYRSDVPAQIDDHGLDVDGSRSVIVRGDQNPSRAPTASASPQTLD